MPSPSSNQPVVVVGGGLSGLAAAVELSSLGIPVLLLEQKPRLGGRAYSFRDETTGEAIDNGQHVLIAGYERTMRFLDRIGTRHLLTVQSQPLLYLHHPVRGLCEFRLPPLVPPIHFLAGILSTNLLTVPDKMRLLRAGVSLQRAPAEHDGRTIAQWLDGQGQSEELKRSFWEPLAISIMNEHIADAAAKVFVHVLRHAFLAGGKNAALALSRVGLSELYVDAASSFIVRHGGRVHVNARVVGLERRQQRASGVVLRDGQPVSCSAVVVAVPHHAIADILPEDEALRRFSLLASTPIVSIHLWFPHEVMKHEFVGLIGRRVQWVFNKRKIARKEHPSGHVSCVISDAGEFVDLSNERLIRLAVEDLRTLHARVPEPTHAVVIREKRATFACTPDADRLRPSHRTSWANVFLAGDWTNTGLPATIEGAILSGERSAYLVAEFLRAG
ncbi:MAG: hypothetical protein C4326_11385 [Ignavibacteria bacterium]